MLIQVRDNNVDQALRALKKKLQREERRAPRHEQRRFQPRPQGERGRHAHKVKPMGGSRRRARG